MFLNTYIIYVLYLTGFSTRPVYLAGGYAVSAVSRFEPHSYCHASRIMHVVVVVVVVVVAEVSFLRRCYPSLPCLCA